MGKGKSTSYCSGCCFCWLFVLVWIAFFVYCLLSAIISSTQQGGKFSLDSAHIETMNLSSRMEIVMQLNITSNNPNRIPGRIRYDSLEFLLFFESFNVAKSATMEPFMQAPRSTTHISSTLHADPSQHAVMSNKTKSTLESAIRTGNLPLHLRINIEGQLSGPWKKCYLKSADDCYFSLNFIAPNGTGGTLSQKCTWTSGCS